MVWSVWERILRGVVACAMVPAAMLLPIASIGPALAQSTTWTGAIDNDWTKAGNWSGGVPTPSGEVIINRVSPSPTVLGVAGAAAGSGKRLWLGQTGTGELTVQNGSALTISGDFVVIGQSGSGFGTLTIQGGSTFNSNTGFVSLGELAATTKGYVTVQGAGSVWNATTTAFTVGDKGEGKLDVLGGGVVAVSGSAALGSQAGSIGNATISGAGSQWNVTGPLLVGGAGTGTLNVVSGGVVTSGGSSYIGNLAGAMGAVNVTGATSRWTVNGDFRVGNLGNGTLNVDAGTVAVIGNMTVADGANSTSSMTIKNGGSLTAGFIGIGANGGSGTMMLESGGTLTNSSYARIGDAATAIGAATVTGAGSLWTINGAQGLTVGNIGTGTLTIQDGGVVTAQGGVVIAQAAGSTGTLNIGAAPGDPLAAPGTLNSPTVSFGAGTGEINFNHTSSNYTFVPVIDGNGRVNVFAGTTIFSADETYTGPTTIAGGTLQVNGSIASPTTVEAAGTLSGSGTINNDVTNFGTVSPGTGGLNEALTINGNYVGQGGTLAIRSELEGDASPTTQLIIAGAGHSATGSTGIVVTNVGGRGAETSEIGIPIVLPQGGATIAGGSFYLAQTAAAGPFEYLLFQGTIDGNGTADQEQTYYLRNVVELIGPDGEPVIDPETGEPELVPAYRPDVSIHSVFGAMARQQGLVTLGTFHDRAGDQRLAGGAGPRTAAWGRLFGQHMEQSHSGHVNAHFDGNTGGLQAGLDAMQWVSPSGHQDRLGLFAAYARTRGDVRGFALGEINRMAGRATLDGTSFGGYWTHLAPTGWYTDTVVMGTRFDADGETFVGNDLESKGYGVTASIEGGYPIPLWGGLRLEPQGQLVYTHINMDDVNDPYSYVAYETPDALSGRLGVRLSADMLPLPYVLRPYLKANVWRDFTPVDSIYFEGVHEIESRHRATTLELGGGVVMQLSPDVGFWVNADYTTDIGSGDEREAVRGTAGLRVKW